MNKDSLPNSISHADLKNYITILKKENHLKVTQEITKHQEDNELKDLLLLWSEASEDVLKMLKKCDEKTIKNRSSKSLMALGALEAHLNMAIDALKASEIDELE